MTAASTALRIAARHPFKGPNDTDASMLREAAQRVADGYTVGGQHTSATVGRVLRQLAHEARQDDPGRLHALAATIEHRRDPQPLDRPLLASVLRTAATALDETEPETSEVLR